MKRVSQEYQSYKFHWTKKIYFYGSYLLYRFLILNEVKKPKMKFFIFEAIYLSSKLINPFFHSYSIFKINFIESVFGKFNLRTNTGDLICVSPAFERLDVNYLQKIISNSIRKRKKILFLDIGADFGFYSIVIGNKFKNYKKLKIISFEPIEESFKLLKKNIRINNLESKIKAFNLALLDRNSKIKLFYNETNPEQTSYSEVTKNHNSVIAKRLDSLNIQFAKYDLIVLKIDVEGLESKVLEGGMKTFQKMETYLLIEDFVNPSIINYLQNKNALFLKKRTPYNSFWYLKKS